MEDLKTFAKTPSIASKYPDFYDALRDFDNIVGLDTIKNNIANRIKFIICSNPKQFKVKDRISSIETRYSKKQKNDKSKSKKRKDRVSRNSKKVKRRKLKPKIELHDENNDDESETEGQLYISPEIINALVEAATKQAVKPSRNNINLNTLIMGNAGTGKTTISIMLANLYKSLNLVTGYKMITRGDIVGKYQGFTSAKLRAIIEQNRGGILILDEAYGINTGENDSFGEEAMVEIIESMTNKSKNISWFFIGYEKQMNKCLISNNDGFKRRMGMTLTLKPPNVEQVVNIFKTCIDKSKWKIKKSDKDYLIVEFRKHNDLMKSYGGDMSILVSLSIEDSIRNMWPDISKKREITIGNVRQAFQKLSEGLVKEVYSAMYI